MAITSLPTQWFLWISGRFITTKTHGKTPTPLIQVCAKMTATTKIMSHSVMHVNKDESLRNINRSNYVLQLGHSFYFCWQNCFKIYYLQKNVTFLDIKCKFKKNTYKGLSYFLECVFNICFSWCFSERFLYKDSGERYSYLPFGIGHRVCLGSNIAKMSVFSFCATLIKNYKITVPDGSPLPDMKPNAGLTNRPKPFEIKLVKRCWFWDGICRWFFSGERLKDYIQWRVLLILTIQRWFDTSFPPEIQMDLYFGLFSVTWLTKGSIYIYLFFVCTCWRIDYLCWYLLRSVVNVFYLLTVLCCIIYIEIYLYLCTACINIFWDKQCFNGNLF